jgi:nitronate monooxygenase
LAWNYYHSTYEQWANAGKSLPAGHPGEHDIITQFPPDRPVERYSRSTPVLIMEGNLEPLAHYAGQSVGLVRNRKSVYEILDEIVEDVIKRTNA